ncbi:MAG: 30S ribosomal protein S19 [Elusimicrobia bacterium]|nr:30S ribosomal protein S19 [Elusimicrobiota bacterium]MDE2238135.1 30S ribosomal protein S19 [Elusimicrobiota bacterium]MDE2425314.1 30S ribosomal protein S19 [Elusimicrobiota bacterium]
MSRSTKKGPFIDQKLLNKVQKMNQSGDKKPIKTWSRACVISPEFVGHTFAVHNGRKFLPIYVTEQMVGHRLGEFSFTRFFKAHGGTHKEATSLT